VSAAAAYAIKLSGYLLPRKLLDRPVIVRLATGLTVGLLASLTILNTVGNGPRIVLIDRNRRAYIVDKRDNDWVKVEDALIERSKVDPTFKCPYE